MARKLANRKHEVFALLLSKGLKQGEAYEKAGYAANPGRASRLAKQYRERVAELRGEHVQSLPALSEGKTLAEMGIDLAWIAKSYTQILDRAVALDKLADANKATSNLERLLRNETEEAAQAEPELVTHRIDINSLGDVLDRVTSLITAAKAPDHAASPSWPEIKALRQVEDSELSS